MLRRLATLAVFGAMAVAGLSACGNDDTTATPSTSPTTASPTATPDTQEFIITLRNQGFQQAETALIAQGNATCLLFSQYTVPNAIDKMVDGAVPGVTTAVPGVSAERNAQVMAYASANYLCPDYEAAVELVLGESIGASITPTATS